MTCAIHQTDCWRQTPAATRPSSGFSWVLAHDRSDSPEGLEAGCGARIPKMVLAGYVEIDPCRMWMTCELETEERVSGLEWANLAIKAGRPTTGELLKPGPIPGSKAEAASH